MWPIQEGQKSIVTTLRHQYIVPRIAIPFAVYGKVMCAWRSGVPVVEMPTGSQSTR